MNRKKMHKINRLKRIVKKLRDPNNGCSWDIVQTYESIAPYTIEESYEVYDAINKKDMLSLKEELGDLLFHIVLYAEMASEDNIFSLDDIIDNVSNKMLRRHPHVFVKNNEKFNENSQSNTIMWENIKAKERKNKININSEIYSELDGVAKSFPALLRAFKVQQRASRVGFDWSDEKGAIDKLKEEIAELEFEIKKNPTDDTKIREEMGDVLFSVSNLSRKLDLEPESILREGINKFEKRFRYMEMRLREENRRIDKLNLEEFDVLWKEAKIFEND